MEQVIRSDLWGKWDLEPQFLIPLSLAVLLYTAGTTREASSRRGQDAVRYGQWLAFASAGMIFVIALASPLDALASQLFSAHMVQHVLLVLLAPPLLVSSRFVDMLVSQVPGSVRQLFRDRWNENRLIQRIWSGADRPFVDWVLFTAVLLIWHVPSLYQMTLVDERLHALEHLSFLAAACIFWGRVLNPGPARARRIDFGASIVYAVIMAVVTGVLGGVLAFASKPWYAAYVESASLWGIRPLDDQQFAGLILWIPSAIIYAATAVVLFVIWLNTVERELREREREVQMEYGPAQVQSQVSRDNGRCV